MPASIMSSKIGSRGYMEEPYSQGRNVLRLARGRQNMCCHESSLVFRFDVDFPRAVNRFRLPVSQHDWRSGEEMAFIPTAH